jgi:hypothetical protein
VEGVGQAVLIRASIGASRRSVKDRQVLSRSLAAHAPILSAAPAPVGVERGDRPNLVRSSVYGVDQP